jgi:hypothetical protein
LTSINLLATKHGRPVDGYTPSFTGGQFSDIEQGFAGELVEFVNAVREGREPAASIRQACHTLAIFEAMWVSTNNGGKPVSVEATPCELVSVNSWTGITTSPRVMSRFFSARGMAFG